MRGRREREQSVMVEIKGYLFPGIVNSQCSVKFGCITPFVRTHNVMYEENLDAQSLQKLDQKYSCSIKVIDN